MSFGEGWVMPAHRQQVGEYKEQLKKLGWTTYDPSGDYHLLNNGPSFTRLQAEELYRKWDQLVNPYGF